MNCKILIVPTQIREEDFLAWCKINYGVGGFKMTKSNLFEIQEVIRNLEDYYERWAFYSELINRMQNLQQSKRNGMPDFFLYSKTFVLFCEFKTYGDALSQDQIYWIEKNKDLPLAIAIAYDPKYDPKWIKDKQKEEDDKGETNQLV